MGIMWSHIAQTNGMPPKRPQEVGPGGVPTVGPLSSSGGGHLQEAVAEGLGAEGSADAGGKRRTAEGSVVRKVRTVHHVHWGGGGGSRGRKVGRSGSGTGTLPAPQPHTIIPNVPPRPSVRLQPFRLCGVKQRACPASNTGR